MMRNDEHTVFLFVYTVIKFFCPVTVYSCCADFSYCEFLQTDLTISLKTLNELNFQERTF